ncbi:hypothetical protein [Rhizobium sp. C4]|uniref:hypothetical protein n=1 Tax=Rhizobium sp. C4 TaxID=1349800 RepID=UPI001E2D89AF|nr:hypothetical protein [Rhizobium sp. C4]MCD2171983.1 hypothetical protein [Rhizobium sp. C4]
MKLETKHSLSACLIAALSALMMVEPAKAAMHGTGISQSRREYQSHPLATPVAERSRAHNVSKGDPERKAILDAVREANADLNDRVPIVFVVEVLRSDGHMAYFRGKVRNKSDGRPVAAEIWGQCEQDPDTALLEALLEKRNGRWKAVQANRCADDVFMTEEDRSRYRALLTDQ